MWPVVLAVFPAVIFSTNIISNTFSASNKELLDVKEVEGLVLNNKYFLARIQTQKESLRPVFFFLPL